MTDMPLSESTVVESVLKQDRVLAVSLTFVLGACAWAYVLAGIAMPRSAFELTAMSMRLGEFVAQPTGWSLAQASLVFVLWTMIATAVLLPAAASMMLVHAGLNRRQRHPENPFLAAVAMLMGFYVSLALFALAATAIHWVLLQSSRLTEAMSLGDSYVVGAFLIVAGLYQFTSTRLAYLRVCRHPFKQLSTRWQDGPLGSLRLGIAHGSVWAACYGPLLLLLFIGGVLNVMWLSGLLIYVLMERVARHASVLSIAFGCVLASGGSYIIISALRP